ncbi:MAG: acyl-CoA reductase, partial [Saprospiraceae bacterium]
EYLQAVIHRTQFNNPWFTKENQERAIQAIAREFLQKEKLEAWARRYDVDVTGPRRKVGLIMAGNIPLVGFHDVVCTFVAGHKAVIKLSEKDQFLLPYLLKLMEEINPASAAYFHIAERLKGFEAVIATGSNNTARYFEAYFGKYPHIIRKNRNSVAVLDGLESDDELLALGRDVFRFFGLGCRNVSKLYLPKGYDFNRLMERLHDFREIIRHDKYKNNFDYNFALVTMNRTPFLNNGCIVLAEDPAIASRIAVLNYEYYEDKTALLNELQARAGEVQCVVSGGRIFDHPTVPFGKTQEPQLDDYPDGVDVMEFLMKI